MFTIAVCDDDMQERMQEVQIVKNIFSQKELEALRHSLSSDDRNQRLRPH